jgi:ligand-binding sensor domain-containing protein
MKKIILISGFFLLLNLTGKTQFIITANWGDKDPYGHIFRSGFKDKAGNFWFGTTGAGVFRYDGKSLTNLTTKNGLSNNWVYAIAEDKYGNMWFGTADWLCSYNGNSFTHFQVVYLFGTKPTAVYSLMADKAGSIWVGTDNAAVYRYDGKGFANILAYPKEKNVHPAPVQSIYQDKKGNIWFASMAHGGLMKYDGKTWSNFTVQDGLADAHIFSISEDRSGNIWFGGGANGLSLFDGKKFIAISLKDGLCENNITSILEDKKGYLRFTSDIIMNSHGGGICRYDGKSFNGYWPKSGLTPNGYWIILEDKEGYIWIGGRNGSLNRYNGNSFVDVVAAGAK